MLELEGSCLFCAGENGQGQNRLCWELSSVTAKETQIQFVNFEVEKSEFVRAVIREPDMGEDGYEPTGSVGVR